VTWSVRGVNCGRRPASASRSYADRCSSTSMCSAGPGVYRQRECFYVASIEGSTRGEASPDQIEREANMEARWWTVDELRATSELVEPPRLHEIVEAQARPVPVRPQYEAAVAGLASAGVSVPEGSCLGAGKSALSGSEDHHGAGRATGVCPACLGRFRLHDDRTLPNHAPAARHVSWGG
jgi:hypothetical protein